MTATGWVHIGILLLVFAGAVAFVLRRMILPAPREGSQGESTGGGGNGGYSGYDSYGGHSHDGGGHGGVGH